MTESAPAPLAPLSDGEIAPALETAHPADPSRVFWHAHGLADRVRREFVEAHRHGDTAGLRARFYLLADYYARTVAILRYALLHRREPLVLASLRNLMTLHRALHMMHRIEPDVVPEAITVGRDIRLRLFEDMIVQVLRESPGPLEVSTITRRVNDLDVLADATEATIGRHLANLVSSGNARLRGDAFVLTSRAYHTMNLDQAVLAALVGPTLVPGFERAGFHGLSDVLARKQQFRALLADMLGLSDATATLFLATVEVLIDSAVGPDVGHWRHADLIGSLHPRPYQYEGYAIFRGYGYQGQLIEAPSGSGKTLIGMLCVQDWLRSLAHGQTILVLVPTVNYQRQWVRELCHKPTGLRLPPHLVFAGTPAGLEAARRRIDFEPCVLVVTYPALAQLGSGVGKGGFDIDSVESFLQGSDVQYVILDEVHKVVEDLHSVSSDVTRALVAWLRDGSLRGLIGFSGTASAYRARFAELGLHLAHVMPAGELIVYGFVAPFAEVGVPFAFSEREQRLRDLVEAYRGTLHEYVAMVGSLLLRRWFSEIALDERIEIGRDLLRMYAGRTAQREALARRFVGWEQGGPLTTAELPLVTIVQLARGWSDRQLLSAACPGTPSGFDSILDRLDRLRAAMRAQVYLPDTRRRLEAERFGTSFDAVGLRQLMTISLTASARLDRTRQGLATTFVGLLTGLSEWSRRIGEGRVATIKAIVEAERATRQIPRVIVFDTGRRIRWQDGVAVPGYAGVGGLFAELLGDRQYTPMAVLSREIYLPYDRDDPLPARIARFIRRKVMLGGLASVLVGLGIDGLDLPAEVVADLRQAVGAALGDYVANHPIPRARRREFASRVAAPLRRFVRRARLGSDLTRRILDRWSLRQFHIRDWLGTFLDYAAVADRFEQAQVGQLEQVGGIRQQFFVVRMPEGDRKQLMYDLTAGIVDADDLPVNLILVSTWARTGWNVVEPNLLIDATATRDVVAWQQLRGRAMRAHHRWTNACYQAVLLLLGADIPGPDPVPGLPVDVVETFAALTAHTPRSESLDAEVRDLLREAHRAAGSTPDDPLAAKIERGALADLSRDERHQLVIELMLSRNKVTHVYELVKASGSTPQVHFDRAAHGWMRSDVIAAKHAAEYAVNPFDGTYSAGPDHAPLLYVADPRKDVPSALRRHLRAVLDDADPRIVRSWLEAIARDPGSVPARP
jgi:hypothetical protein